MKGPDLQMGDAENTLKDKELGACETLTYSSCIQMALISVINIFDL